MTVEKDDFERIQAMLNKASRHPTGGKSVEVHGSMILDNGKSTQATIFVHDHRDVPSCRNIGLFIQGKLGEETVFAGSAAGVNLEDAFDVPRWQRGVKTGDKVKDLTLVWE